MTSFWVYFAAQPLLWIVLTVVAFIFSRWLNRKLGGLSLFHPVLISMGLLISLLLLTGTDYDTYFDGAQFIHFLLGPATVALAVPLYDYFDRIRADLVADSHRHPVRSPGRHRQRHWHRLAAGRRAPNHPDSGAEVGYLTHCHRYR